MHVLIEGAEGLIEAQDLGPKGQRATKGDALRLAEGYISLQSESHPIEFRKVELMVLEK